MKILIVLQIFTAFLSMWMANISAVLLMIPIVRVVAVNIRPNTILKKTEFTKRMERGYLLGILFAAAAGGIITPLGSPLSLIFISTLRQEYPFSPDISFGNWMANGLPTAMIVIFFSFFLVSWKYFDLLRCGKDEEPVTLEISTAYEQFEDNATTNQHLEDVNEIRSEGIDYSEIFARKLEKLGPIKFAELIILFVWIMTMILWVFRADLTFRAQCEPWVGCAPGWSRLFTNRLHLDPLFLGQYIQDAVPVIILVAILFLVPTGDSGKSRILDWKTAVKLPWDVLLLIGSGFALARGFNSTGLAEWLASGLFNSFGERSVFAVMWGLIIVIVILSTVVTSPTMNAVLVPIFAPFALQVGVNPLIWIIPGSIATNFAFALATSTSVNAVIFSTRKLDMQTLAKYGSIMCFVGVMATGLVFMAIGQFTFRANEFDSKQWVKPTNVNK